MHRNFIQRSKTTLLTTPFIKRKLHVFNDVGLVLQKLDECNFVMGIGDGMHEWLYSTDSEHPLDVEKSEVSSVA